MPLLKINSDNNEKEIKDLINKNIASSMRTQPSFAKLLQLNGCPTIKLGLMGSKIRKQLIKEAKNGDLTVESVMPRAYDLVGEYLGIDDVKTFKDLTVDSLGSEDLKSFNDLSAQIDSIRRNGFNATLPYTSSGVRLGQAGGNNFGGASYVSTQFGEGQTQWKNSKVFFVENGLRIDETEQFIHYKQVDYVDYSEKSDRKGLFAFKRSGITFLMKNGEQIIMRVMTDELNAIKHLIDADMKNIEKTKVTNDIDSDDILIKYFDMFEKGLITREEFNQKKEELLYNNVNDNSLLKTENNQQNKNSFCSNCGCEIDEDSNFCTNCGNKIK